MTRKRFVKLIMGHGCSRNEANDTAICLFFIRKTTDVVFNLYYDEEERVWKPVAQSYADWYRRFTEKRNG